MPFISRNPPETKPLATTLQDKLGNLDRIVDRYEGRAGDAQRSVLRGELRDGLDLWTEQTNGDRSCSASYSATVNWSEMINYHETGGRV